MKTASRFTFIDCGQVAAHSATLALLPVRSARPEKGRASLGSLLLLLPIVLGTVLFAKLFLGPFHWWSVVYLLGAAVCFLIAAKWFSQMRDSPCLSSL